MKGNMSQSRNAEELKHFVQNTRKINGQTLDNDVQIDNVESADKLKTARTIGLSGAVVSTPTAFNGSKNIDIPITDIKESYVVWGGKNRPNYVTPIDVAMLPELGTNRLAFIPQSAVKLERSADSGVTWTDVSANFNCTSLCTGAITFGNGNTDEDKSVNRQHRVTIDCIEGKLYGVLSKIAINSTSAGATGCKCRVETGVGLENTQWTAVAESSADGWPGWCIINVDPLMIGNENACRYVRLTFSITGVDNAHTSDFKVMRLRFISKMFFDTGSSAMARTGHLYTYDSEQNATFPKNLIILGNTLKIGSTAITETQLQALLNLLTT